MPTGSANFLGVKSGDELNGIFKKEAGYANTFEVMHLATASNAGETAPESFDAAMKSGFVFELYACKSEGQGGCNFAAAPTMVESDFRWNSPVGWTGVEY